MKNALLPTNTVLWCNLLTNSIQHASQVALAPP